MEVVFAGAEGVGGYFKIMPTIIINLNRGTGKLKLKSSSKRGCPCFRDSLYAYLVISMGPKAPIFR